MLVMASSQYSTKFFCFPFDGVEIQSLEGEAFLYQNLIKQYKPISKIIKTSWLVPSGEVSAKGIQSLWSLFRGFCNCIGDTEQAKYPPEMWNMYAAVIWNMYVCV